MAARFIPRNLADVSAGCTVSSSLATFPSLPVTNLQVQGRDTICRLSSPASSSIVCSWAAAQTLDSIALCGTNLTLASTVRILLYSDSATTVNVYDSGVMTAALGLGAQSVIANIDEAEFKIFKNAEFWIPQRADVKSINIVITDAANPDGYVDVARLVVGRYKEFKYAEPYSGANLSIESLTTMERNKSGSNVSNKGANYQRLEIKKEWIAEATDWADMMAIYTRCGMDRDFYYSQYPGDTSAFGLYHRGVFKFGQISAVDRWVYGLSRTSFTLEGQ